MSKKPVLELDLGQIAQIYADRILSLLQRGITLEEALAQILQKLAVDVARARSHAEEALSNVHRYVKTEEDGSTTGLIPTQEEKLARYMREGVRDAEEKNALLALASRTSEQEQRLRDLDVELLKDAANARDIRETIANNRALHDQWQERYEERLARYKRLQADFETLQHEGLALIAQIRDAELAAEAREADRDRQLGVGDDATTMLDDLREQAAEAARREGAALQLDKVMADEQSLDDELADRERDEALMATIAEFQQMAGA